MKLETETKLRWMADHDRRAIRAMFAECRKQNKGKVWFESGVDSEDNYWSAIRFWGALILASIIVLSFIATARAEEVNMQKIMMIESSGNPRAWRKQDDSRGLYQITPVCLREYNKSHARYQHTKSDLWNPAVNLKIASWYLNVRIPQMLKHYGITDTVEHRLICYNAGISYLTKNKTLPKITRKYLAKYRGAK